MNIIQQAAEAKYPGDRFCDPPDYVSVRHYEEHVTHFLQFLSQQGDAAIARSIIEGSISTWYNQDDAEELLCKALAIGRATGNKEFAQNVLDNINAYVESKYQRDYYPEENEKLFVELSGLIYEPPKSE